VDVSVYWFIASSVRINSSGLSRRHCYVYMCDRYTSRSMCRVCVCACVRLSVCVCACFLSSSSGLRGVEIRVEDCRVYATGYSIRFRVNKMQSLV